MKEKATPVIQSVIPVYTGETILQNRTAHCNWYCINVAGSIGNFQMWDQISMLRLT